VYKLDLPDAAPPKLDETFKLLSGMITAPIFTPLGVKTEVPIVLAEMRERTGPQSRVLDETRGLFFKGQLLASRSPIGTVQTLEAADAAAVKAFHDKWYRPDNTVIVVAGDADPATLVARIEQWFGGSDRKRYFQLDRSIGSLLAHPEEYFAIGQMNDHHFHYGYWIRTIAELALREPALAGPQKWGPMVDLMVADIATARRGDERFPFLRHFDAYEGHSWASGIALGPWGNNQESSSEAINAWVGLILWGEVRGDTALRDLGIWLYTTESHAIDHYWFDRHRLVFPPEYPHAETSMLFGSRYSHNTWWTDEPRQIKGINLLPITTASTYLGSDPDYVKRNLATLEADTKVFASRGKRADPPDIWQDLFAKYLAMADPGAALTQWNRWGSVELGDTRTHTWHWIASLKEMGPPDLSVTADTTFFSVFRRSDGLKTYLTFHLGKEPTTVRFSDGHTMVAAPRTLARTTRQGTLR